MKAKVFQGVGQVVVLDPKNRKELMAYGIGQKLFGYCKPKNGSVYHLMLCDLPKRASADIEGEITEWLKQNGYVEVNGETFFFYG